MSTNINKAGIDTAKFLPRVTPSNYSQVQGIDFSQVTTAFDTGTTTLADVLSVEDLITGTRGAVLPMTITIADKDNARISFVLLINPDNMNHGKTNSVYAGMARQGFITQMWGPNQDLLTGTGKTAGFYASGEGLTDISSQRSFGFKNFMALFSTYRNNGYELLDQTNLNNLTRVINIVHGIEIEYDGQTFLGHFNNFTLDDSAESPYVFNYNFEFVVSSLSTNYNEIRGHFIPSGEIIVRKPKLVSKVGRSVLNEGDQFIPVGGPIADSGVPKINWDSAIDFVLVHEGGYVNNPADKGGETKYGISKNSYPGLDIKNLTREQAMAIYNKDYWLPNGCQNMSNDFGLVVMDSAVNSGQSRAQAWLKQSNGDVNKYLDIREEFYKKLAATPKKNKETGAIEYPQQQFLRGWLQRIADLRKTVNKNPV